MAVRPVTLKELPTGTEKVPVPLPEPVMSNEYPVRASPVGGVQPRVRLLLVMTVVVGTVAESGRVARR